jgi:hypothetical protein
MSLVPSKALAKEIAAEGGRFLGLVQRVIRMSETQTKHAALIEKQAAEIDTLRDTVRALQAREAVIIARAEAAAARAAAATVSDLARRIGYIEGRSDHDNG